jgi:hypothetical protein
VCLASPPSPDLLNISCDRISWSSVRIRIGLICERWRKEWKAWCRSGPRSAVRTFPCLWPAPRWQCDFVVEARWNVMAHAQKSDFVFRRNGRVRLNRRGRQFSRLLAAEVCASAVVMLDTACSEVVWRVLATHSIRQFPLHFPSRASPCAITFQLDCTCRIIVSGRSLPGLYHLLFMHVLQQDMLVVLPFSLIFRSTPRGEGWMGLEAHQFLILWDLVKSRMSNYLLQCQKLT